MGRNGVPSVEFGLSRRRLLRTMAVVAPAGIATLAGGCALNQGAAPTSSRKPAAVEVLHNWDATRGELAGLQEMIARFQKEAPQITVKQNVVAGSQLTAAQAAAAAGTAPDVSFTTIVLVPGFAIISDPIEKVLKGARDWKLDDYFDGARGAMSTQGVMLAAPYSMSTFIVNYNLDALTKVGLKAPPATWADTSFWTWDTLNQYAEKLTVRSGSDTTQWGWSPPPYAANHPFYFQQLLWQAGGEWLDAAGQKLTFQQSPGVDGLQWWVDQIRGKRVAPPVDWALQYQQEAAFLNGSVAMTQHQPERLPIIAKSAAFRWGAALPPKNKRQAAVAAGFGWVVLKDARQKEAAADFVRFLSLPAQLVSWDIKVGGLPPRKSAGQQPEWQQFLSADPRWQVHWEAVKMTKSFPTIPGWSDVQDILQKAIRSALDGNAAPKAALEDAAQQMEPILTKARTNAR